MANDSTQVSSFLNPVRGVRDAMERRGIIPKNHAADNVRKLREMQDENRTRKLTDSTESTADFKMSRFRNVESVVSKTLKTGNENQNGTHHQEFLKAHSKTAVTEQKAEQPMARASRPKLKPALPSAAELMATVEKLRSADPMGDKKDYIKANALCTIRSKQATEARDVSSKDRQEKSRIGKVPKYLEERKAHWELQAQERKRIEDEEKCPAGMYLLSENERLETLDSLKASLEDAATELHRVPLTSDTLRARKRREELEQRIEEIESAIGVFSKEKVYIKND